MPRLRQILEQPDGSFAILTETMLPPFATAPTPVPPTPVYGMNDKRIVVAPGGNDSNTGTDARPLATVDRALELNNSAPDAWIYLRGGTYRQNIHYGRVTRTPTAARPLIIRNWPDEVTDFQSAGAGNLVLDMSNNTNEARSAYVWLHGLNPNGIDDNTGNGRIVEMSDTPGPFRITGCYVKSKGTLDFHDHGIYLAKNVNKSGQPCLIAGNRFEMGIGSGDKSEGWGIQCYTSYQFPTVWNLEVAWNVGIGGSGLILAGGLQSGRIHHNSGRGNTRGSGVFVGGYTPVAAKNVEVDHNIYDGNEPYKLDPGSTANEHDNWWRPSKADPRFVNATDLHLQAGTPVPSGCGVYGTTPPRWVTAGPEMVNGQFTW